MASMSCARCCGAVSSREGSARKHGSGQRQDRGAAWSGEQAARSRATLLAGARWGRYCSPSGTSPKTLGRRMSAPLSMSLAGAFLRPSAAQWWAAVMPFLPLSLKISQVCCRLLSKCSEPEGRPSSTQILLRGAPVSPLSLIRRLYPAGWRDASVRPRETADPWVCHRRLGLLLWRPAQIAASFDNAGDGCREGPAKRLLGRTSLRHEAGRLP